MKTVFKGLGFLIILFGCFGFGFSFRDLGEGRLPSGAAVRSLLNMTDQSTTAPSKVFKDAYTRILTDYYKKVDADELKYAGLEGLMASLGDPHTAFLNRRMAEDFVLETKANFVGVGARLSPDALGAKAVVVFEEGPAAKAGLKVNDIITGVNGKSVVGAEVDTIAKSVRGEEGTTVKLQISRADMKPFTITVKRAVIVAPTVESKPIEGTPYGYLNIVSFSEPTAQQFDEAVAKLEKRGIKGLVIDVRGNPGGLLETDVELLSRFFENKTVVKMKMRDSREEVATTVSGYKHNFRYPIVVLQNEDSASAAEIFAGVLKEYNMATLVGEHSYGKASVQNVRTMVDGSLAKITIGRYLLPSGKDIGRKVDEDGQYVSGGLEPDIKVELEMDKQVTLGDPKSDNQLARAIQVLDSKQ